MATPRFNILMYVVKTLLLLASSFLAIIPGEKARVWAFGVTLVVGAASLLFWLVYTLPFYNARTNMVYGSLLSAFLFGSLVRLLSAVAGADSYVGLIIFALGVLPVCL